MTREEIIRMAREAGIYRPYLDDDEDPNKDPPRWVTVGPIPPLLERFAALVAAHEREQCAQVVDDFGDEWMCDSHELAKIIRARGKK